MVGRWLPLGLVFAASPAFAQPQPTSVSYETAAKQLFERDWVLMNWALKKFDADRDILLEPQEASAAAQAFRSLADANGDGRVTPDEYRQARKAILTNY